MYGPGDEQTWGACYNHPHDPRTHEYEDDDDVDVYEAQDLPKRHSLVLLAKLLQRSREESKRSVFGLAALQEKIPA